MSDDPLSDMRFQAGMMRLAGKMMAHHFPWRHDGPVSRGNFENASKHRRIARRKLAVAAKRYVDALKAHEIEMAIQREKGE